VIPSIISVYILIFANTAEQKTSSYLETNLASVDRAATPNVKSVQQAESAVLIGRPDDDGQPVTGDSDVDWMFCIERTGTSKKLILLIVVVLLTSIVFCVCTGTTAPGQPYWHDTEVSVRDANRVDSGAPRLVTY
jgi:hypothetical protein